MKSILTELIVQEVKPQFILLKLSSHRLSGRVFGRLPHPLLTLPLSNSSLCLSLSLHLSSSPFNYLKNWVIPSWKPVPDTMTGGLRSNVKRYTVKCLNLGGATMPETKSSSSLSDPRDADSADKKPRDGSSLPETSLGDGKVPCLPMLTSTAKVRKSSKPQNINACQC
ncbi:hypothetical protein ACFX13_001414 [Malus domestica]